MNALPDGFHQFKSFIISTSEYGSYSHKVILKLSIFSIHLEQ